MLERSLMRRRRESCRIESMPIRMLMATVWMAAALRLFLGADQKEYD